MLHAFRKKVNAMSINPVKTSSFETVGDMTYHKDIWKILYSTGGTTTPHTTSIPVKCQYNPHISGSLFAPDASQKNSVYGPTVRTTLHIRKLDSDKIVGYTYEIIKVFEERRRLPQWMNLGHPL